MRKVVIGDCVLYQGDCLEILPTLEAASVDMVCADPPYGTTACKWDSVIPLEPLWACLERVIKPRAAVVMTASQPFTTDLINSKRDWFKYCWVWNKVKPNGMGYAQYQPMRVTEDVVVFCNGSGTYNFQKHPRRTSVKYRNYSHSAINNKSLGRMKDVWETDFLYPTSLLTFSNADQTEKEHPTQKPVALMEYLIRTYTNEGDTVLDFCFGSGTTAIACQRTERKFFGCERDENYFNIAVARIEKEHEEQQHTLFQTA